DRALIGIAGEGAFEQEQVGLVHQRALEMAIDHALERVEPVVQRAPMRRVDADGLAHARPQADDGASLGAVAVQHIRLQSGDQAAKAHPHRKVGRPRLAVTGDAVYAKREARGDLCKRLVGALAAGEAVGNDADLVAAVGLAVGEIDDVTENAADRRAHRVKDFERFVGRGHALEADEARHMKPSAANPAGGSCRAETGGGAYARHTTTFRENAIPIKGFHGYQNMTAAVLRVAYPLQNWAGLT